METIWISIWINMENPRHLFLTRVNISELCLIDELVDNENFFEEEIFESNDYSLSVPSHLH